MQAVIVSLHEFMRDFAEIISNHAESLLCNEPNIIQITSLFNEHDDVSFLAIGEHGFTNKLESAKKIAFGRKFGVRKAKEKSAQRQGDSSDRRAKVRKAWADALVCFGDFDSLTMDLFCPSLKQTWWGPVANADMKNPKALECLEHPLITSPEFTGRSRELLQLVHVMKEELINAEDLRSRRDLTEGSTDQYGNIHDDVQYEQYDDPLESTQKPNLLIRFIRRLQKSSEVEVSAATMLDLKAAETKHRPPGTQRSSEESSSVLATLTEHLTELTSPASSRTLTNDESTAQVFALNLLSALLDTRNWMFEFLGSALVDFDDDTAEVYACASAWTTKLQGILGDQYNVVQLVVEYISSSADGLVTKDVSKKRIMSVITPALDIGIHLMYGPNPQMQSLFAETCRKGQADGKRARLFVLALSGLLTRFSSVLEGTTTSVRPDAFKGHLRLTRQVLRFIEALATGAQNDDLSTFLIYQEGFEQQCNIVTPIYNFLRNVHTNFFERTYLREELYSSKHDSFTANAFDQRGNRGVHKARDSDDHPSRKLIRWENYTPELLVAVSSDLDMISQGFKALATLVEGPNREVQDVVLRCPQLGYIIRSIFEWLNSRTYASSALQTVQPFFNGYAFTRETKSATPWDAKHRIKAKHRMHKRRDYTGEGYIYLNDPYTYAVCIPCSYPCFSSFNSRTRYASRAHIPAFLPSTLVRSFQ